MALLRPTVWTQQPQQARPVDGDWLVADVGRLSPSLKGLRTVLNGVGEVKSLLQKDKLPTSQVTVLLYGKALTTNNDGEFGNIVDGVDASRMGGHVPYTDGTVYFDFGGHVNGSTRVQVSGLTFAEEDIFILTSGPRGMEIWQNGTLRASNSATPSRTQASTGSWGLGTNSNASPSAAKNSKWYLSAVNAKQISTQQIKSLSANPWQIFQPIRRQLFVASAVSGASCTFTATTDAVTNAFSAQSIPPSAASFAATTASPSNAFAARVSPLAAFAATTASPTNAFAARVSPVTAFAATTASPSAIFVAKVSPVVSFNATTGAVTANFSAGVGNGCAFNVTTQSPTNSFAAGVPVSASFAATTASPSNAFSAEVITGGATASFSATTASPVSNFVASVSPVAQFAATSANAIFTGSAAGSPLTISPDPKFTATALARNQSVSAVARIKTATASVRNYKIASRTS
jgi:hypothetical protein